MFVLRSCWGSSGQRSISRIIWTNARWIDVIAHEQTHIRRRDHWWKPLGFLLLTVHWFNPLLWLGYILLCRDIELACDEKVIREMGSEQRADYTQALVSCSVSRRSIAACPLAFGEVGIKERVKSVMNYKKPAFWIVLASVVVCAVAAVCFLTDPKTERSSPSVGDNVSGLGPAQTEKWFDYLENPEEMNWDGRLEIALPEYPGVTFRCYPEKMEAVTENEITPLYTGMPIWNTYFCDLTGDGLPDLCSTVTFGSGIIDSRIIVCDYANGESYTLEDRGKYDYSLRLDESDGSLCVVQRAHDSGDIAAVGELFFSDSGLHLQVIKTNFETHKFTSVTIRNDGEDTLHITIGSDETALPTGEETTLTYAAFEVENDPALVFRRAELYSRMTIDARRFCRRIKMQSETKTAANFPPLRSRKFAAVFQRKSRTIICFLRRRPVLSSPARRVWFPRPRCSP